MAKFKQGDRVVAPRKCSQFGTTGRTAWAKGVVMEDKSFCPWVKWDVGNRDKIWAELEERMFPAEIIWRKFRED